MKYGANTSAWLRFHTSYFIHDTSYISSSRGVTLIDTIVGSALMLVVFLGIAAAFQFSVEVVTTNKARAGAIALGNERMEYLKSLSYAQIGVIGGIPAGNVVQLETVVLNAITYTRRTMVFYSDDPQDGTGGSDSNGITADYKTIRVEVSWMAKNIERNITLVGRVSPSSVESAVPGGTITINAVNAASVPLFNAQVDIANTETAPAINLRTYTDMNGTVSFIGAPAASNYQITVSKPGYSTAQTYPVTGPNPNPDPRHLTVSNNQTTSATFAIDLTSSKTIETYKQTVPRTWTDTFANGSSIATTSNTTTSGGVVRLAGSVPYAPAGSLQSVDITSTLLARWNELSWVDTTPALTDIRYHIYDATSGGATLIPDSVLSGNSAGFTDSPIDLSMISTSTYRILRIGADLSSSDSSVTPNIDSWNMSYDYGPEPFPNFSFTLRGAKTIGNSPTVYKYDATIVSDTNASLSLPTLEWDTYTIGMLSTSGYDLAESCAPQPEALPPGSTQTTRVYVLPDSTHSLLVDVRASGGALVNDATAVLTRTGFSATKKTSVCGQAFFSSLTNAIYSITVSKTGYQNYSNANLNISGDTKLSVVLQP
ncbi:carboxypeptidase regulatory-like domain-containing protein [Candidatus Kaiserbacteria bacterium]|nr:carboxypeptidase regulatory-like domain-containing protein [Candidatus Kaiserbacteria bacterium]